MWAAIRCVVVQIVLAVLLAISGSALPPGPPGVIAQTVAPANMPTARAYPGVVTAADGKIYAIRGQAGAHYGIHPGTVEAYDTASNTWTLRASMPTARYLFGTAAATNGKLYAIAGSDIGAIDPGNSRRSWAAAPTPSEPGSQLA